MAKQNLWAEYEVQLALVLYLTTPFGKIHNKNPRIIKLATLISRTPSAVSLKMSNLASVDQSLDRKGMANASALDRQVWAAFLENPDSIIKAEHQMENGLEYVQNSEHAPHSGFGEGTDQPIQTTQRRGQTLFRKSILTSYGSRCALTDMDEPKLLVASHIIGWAERPDTRMNPHNGICLNPLHDQAFDKHLISFGEHYELLIADHVPKRTKEALGKVQHKTLRMPERFLPSQEFLETHRARFYATQP